MAGSATPPDMGLVSFVGAGPGDPELITVAGLARLRRADVVIHDRLVAPELLAEAPAHAERLDVGKAPGRHCVGQDEINWLLVDAARLRGPVEPAGGPRDPGVTSATAAAARAGISLTARGTASTVVLATGTDQTGHGRANLDWAELARVDGTLVFYMAVGALVTVTASLTALGRDAREPALVVERVGTAGERVIAGRLGDIADRARAAEVMAPAVLITGPTIEGTGPGLTPRPSLCPRVALPTPAPAASRARLAHA
ncbi:MAG: uroporphyrin-III C-methyltransferase [Candidatus Rokubacteria bacterium]|nr:uroporphyrin-III C-methyltransferase [Candidatus Rokubacteria bacterium]